MIDYHKVANLLVRVYIHKKLYIHFDLKIQSENPRTQRSYINELAAVIGSMPIDDSIFQDQEIVDWIEENRSHPWLSNMYMTRWSTI